MISDHTRCRNSSPNLSTHSFLILNFHSKIEGMLNGIVARGFSRNVNAAESVATDKHDVMRLYPHLAVIIDIY